MTIHKLEKEVQNQGGAQVTPGLHVAPPLKVRYLKRRHLIDVTEVFRFIDAEKKYRIVKLAFYLILFVLVIIGMVIAIVNNLIDDEEERVPGFGLF